MTASPSQQIWILARRELTTYLHAPLGYIVAVLFTLLQGFSFWYLVSAMADPTQPAPLGAALAGHFGGSVLSVTALVAAVAAIAMRLVAEDRRQGTFEVLLSAPVSEGAAMIGKWLGGTVFFALLWLPSALYPLILLHYAAPAATLDTGPIISALVGMIALGGALMALGLAASAATSNQIVAALATTLVAMVWILIGDIPELAPQMATDWPTLSAMARHLAVRAYLDDLARGLIPLGAIVLYVSVAALGLAVATTVALIGRRRRPEMQRRWLAVGLLTVIAVCGNTLAARHPLSWDVSRARMNSLDRQLRAILDDVGATLPAGDTIEVASVRAGLDLFAPLQGEVDRLLERMVARQPALVVRHIDPALQPGVIAEMAGEFAIPVANLRDGGMVVFQRGGRRRAVDVWDMAEFQADTVGPGRLAAFRAQAAFARALAEVMDARRPGICHTTGHGELRLNADPVPEPGATAPADGPDWSDIARRVTRDGARLHPLPVLAAGVPGHCQVVIMAGPRHPLSASAVRALTEFLARGGGLLLALPDRANTLTGARLKTPGLDLLLAEFGIRALAADVVDPDAALTGADAWFTTTGYERHPITAGFADRRATVWLRPRALQLVAVPGAGSGDPSSGDSGSLRPPVSQYPLVVSSPSAFGETSPAALGPARRDERDIAGPLAVAVAAEDSGTGARVVVLGSAESVSAQVGATLGSSGGLLVVRSLAWLHRRVGAPGSGTGADEGDEGDEGIDLAQMRLLMTSAQLTATFVLCVGLIPGGFALVGVLIWRRRRRA